MNEDNGSLCVNRHAIDFCDNFFLDFCFCFHLFSCLVSCENSYPIIVLIPQNLMWFSLSNESGHIFENILSSRNPTIEIIRSFEKRYTSYTVYRFMNGIQLFQLKEKFILFVALYGIRRYRWNNVFNAFFPYLKNIYCNQVIDRECVC